MIALLSRVNRALLKVEKKKICEIGKGAVLFLGIEKEDSLDTAAKMADKISSLRIFSDSEGKFNLSFKEKEYALLSVPNFTLCANVSSGRRPSFANAQSSAKAKELYGYFNKQLKDRGIEVAEGIFGALMEIDAEFFGPANFIVDSQKI